MTHTHTHAPLQESLALSSGSWEKFRFSASFNLKNVYNSAHYVAIMLQSFVGKLKSTEIPFVVLV